MAKKIRLTVLCALLLGTLVMGFVGTPAAVAVAPCDSWCTNPANCHSKCACDTPEWGIKVTFCSQCPWAPGNACTL